MDLFPASDGDNFPGLLDELAPSLAAGEGGDDLVVEELKILLECGLSRRDRETVSTEFSSGAFGGKVRRDGVGPAATLGSAPRDLVLLPDISKGRLHRSRPLRSFGKTTCVLALSLTGSSP